MLSPPMYARTDDMMSMLKIASDTRTRMTTRNGQVIRKSCTFWPFDGLSIGISSRPGFVCAWAWNLEPGRMSCCIYDCRQILAPHHVQRAYIVPKSKFLSY